VTSNLNYSFLRGVKLERVYAEARLLRLGRRLATVDVQLYQDDPERPVGQATVTYALPDT
jgi:acyl-coenzyme A thioesterase PaaI-like protein